MTTEKMTRDIAQDHVQRWVDHKNIPQSKVEANQDAVDIMVDAFQDGTFEMDEETFVITHNLRQPILNTEGEVQVEKLEFKARARAGELQGWMKGIKANDGDGRVQAVIAGLSSTARGIITKLDTVDYSIAQNIAVFFL